MMQFVNIASEINLIMKLPIFLLAKSRSYVSLINNSYCVLNQANFIPEVLIPDNCILQSENPQETILLSLLGVRVLSHCQYYCQVFLSNIKKYFEEFPIQTLDAIVSMLSELPKLINEDRSIIDLLKKTAFIPCKAKLGDFKLKKSSEIYDPEQLEMVELLPEENFPCAELRREDILVYLRTLGMQTVIDWPAIIDCANSISSLPIHDEVLLDSIPRGVEYGLNLLKFLDKNAYKLFDLTLEVTAKESKINKRSSFTVGALFSNIFNIDITGEAEEAAKESIIHKKNMEIRRYYIEQLLEINWVPIIRKLDMNYLPYNLENLVFAKPIQVRPLLDAMYCSSSYCFIDLTVTNPLLHKSFGWNKPLSCKTIAVQLREISALYSKIRAENNENMDIIRENISALIPQLYLKLNAWTEENEASAVLSILQNVNWIWVGDTFVGSDKVAYTIAVNSVPYLFQLPKEFSVYQRLFSIFAIKQSFTPRDLLYVLQCMAYEHVGKNDSLQPLSVEKVNLAISLVTLLAADVNSCKNQPVYFPDKFSRLRLTQDLVYDDVPWLFGDEYSLIRKDKFIVHSSISASVAEKFNVKSLRVALIDQNIEQNLFAGIASTNGSQLESFGQAESITNRLKTILDLYPEGNPIYSELIQNADDAGAKIVKILLDENTYGVESLLSSKLASLQGPALLFYNDAMFSDADYRALGKIGQGTKLEKLSTTGRFGLGFNSTYHLTDAPSFVSGDYLVIFDPHCCFAPGATTNQPGLRVKYGNGKSDVVNTFKDQFAPFKHFECLFAKSYQGTLFRFPLV